MHTQQQPVAATAGPHVSGTACSLAAACPDYAAILAEYHPLVQRLVQQYPWQRVEEMSAHAEGDGSCVADQLWGWCDGLPAVRNGDVLHHLRNEAEAQPHSPSPSSRECRVESAAAATSGSSPVMPSWVADAAAWVDQQRALWPLQPEHIAELFADDEDGPALVRWARDGVPIVHPQQSVPAYDCRNYPVEPSLAAHAAAAAQQELREHHVAVPPAGMHSPWVHATAAVPKGPAAAPTGARRIHDFARPSGAALNDHIRYLPRAFSTARQFAEGVQQGGWMAKVDVHAYFHAIGAFPGHWPYLAFRVPAASLPGNSSSGSSGEVEVWGTRLMFGLRHGPEVADRFSQAVVRLMRKLGWEVSYALLDDFSIAEPDRVRCWLGWHVLCAVLLHMGFVPTLRKSAAPSQLLQLLGVEIDSVAMQLRLTAARVQELQQLAAAFSARRRCTKRELDSLLGKLQWASDVVFGGSLALNPVRRCGRACRKPHHKVYLVAEARLALQWWHTALQEFNGHRRILGRRPIQGLLLSTDACGAWDTGTAGVGVFVDGGFCGLTGEQCRQLFSDAPAADDDPIQLWELFAVLVLVRLFGPYLHGQYWELAVDNTNVQSWLLKGTVRGTVCYERALHYLLQLFKLQWELDMRLFPVWISSSSNALADAASRQQWADFGRALLPWLRQRGRWHSSSPPLPWLVG